MEEIDKDIKTFSINMLKDLNYDNAQVVHHETKKELNAEITQFLTKHSK